MTYIVGFISQKGGVGKSTLARLLARDVAYGNGSVKIADTDIQQGTAYNWMRRRALSDLKPEIQVETFSSVESASKESGNYDVFIFDGAPSSSKDTLKIAKLSDLVVIPTSQGIDDLDPSILLAHELVDKGIELNSIRFSLVKVTDSETEIRGARNYIERAGFSVLNGEIPVRTGFSRAHDLGYAISEVPYASLRKRVDTLAQSLVDAISENNKVAA